MIFKYTILNKYGASLAAYGESEFFDEKTSTLSVFLAETDARVFHQVASYNKENSELPPTGFFHNEDRYGSNEI